MLHLHQGEATIPVKLHTTKENVAAVSKQISTPHVLNELARHEIKQSKVSKISFSVDIVNIDHAPKTGDLTLSIPCMIPPSKQPSHIGAGAD